MHAKTIAIAAVFLLAAGGLAAWGMGAFDASEPASGSFLPAAQDGHGAGCCPGGGMKDTGTMSVEGGACPAMGAQAPADGSDCCPGAEMSKTGANAECEGCPSLKANVAAAPGCGGKAGCGGPGCGQDSCDDPCENCSPGN